MPHQNYYSCLALQYIGSIVATTQCVDIYVASDMSQYRIQIGDLSMILSELFLRSIISGLFKMYNILVLIPKTEVRHCHTNDNLTVSHYNKP